MQDIAMPYKAYFETCLKPAGRYVLVKSFTAQLKNPSGKRGGHWGTVRDEACIGYEATWWQEVATEICYDTWWQEEDR
jgi:hypothetical protein